MDYNNLDLWMPKRWRYSFENEVIKQLFKGNEIVFLDGGAAGEVSEPFNRLEGTVKSIRVEPRGEDSLLDLDGCIYIDGGLSDSSSPFELHLNTDPTTSSRHPPNTTFLERFDLRVAHYPRIVERVVKIQAITIDNILKKLDLNAFNVLKFDIHSSEKYALLGAKDSLARTDFVLVETWHNECHTSQPLHGEIEMFLSNIGFEILSSKVSSAWHTKNADTTVNRQQLISSEMLFGRPPANLNDSLKAAVIYELFGFIQKSKDIIKTLDISDELKSLWFKEMSKVCVVNNRRYNNYILRFSKKIYQLILNKL
jgi:hypothetical protein